MPIESQDREIGGITFRVTQLPAGQGRKILIRLARILGPSLGALAGALGDAKTLGDLKLDVVGLSIERLLEAITEKDFDELCALFAKFTEYAEDGGASDTWPSLSNPGKFDALFAGRYDLLVGWFGFCLGVNFGSFFDGRGIFGNLLERARAVVRPMANPPSESTSPKEQTG